MKLTEGLIKLPQRLLAEMESFVLTWYFAYVQATIERKFRFDDESLDRAHALVRAAMKHHGVEPTPSQVRKARDQKAFMKTFVLDEELYDVSLKMNVKLKLVLERHKRLASNIGVYRDSTGFITLSAYNLHMTGASLQTVSAVRRSLQKVPELLGFLEHELTHLVQYRTLALKHEDQVTGDYAQDAEFNDEYGLAQVEFDPLIKSELARFKQLTAKYQSYPGYNKRELLDAFTFSGPTPKWMSPTDRSQLLEVLKRRAPVRWRKAVKLFTSVH